MFESGIVAYACNPCTWVTQAGDSGIQDHPRLHDKTSLNYMTLHLNNNYKIKNIVGQW